MSLSSASRRSIALAAAGLVLWASGWAAVLALPRGPQEFAYGDFSRDTSIWNPMFGFTVEQLALHVAGVVLMTPGLWLVVGLVAATWTSPVDRPALARRARTAAVAWAVGLFLVTLLGVTRGGALCDDELSYAEQARLLAHGELGTRVWRFMVGEPFIVGGGQGYTGKYLFGEPLMQVPGVLLGYPAALHLPLLLLALWLVWRMVRLEAGEELADWATAFLAASPMVPLVSASGLSQATSLASVAAAGWGLASIRAGASETGLRWLAAGVALAAAARPQVAVPVGAVLVPLALLAMYRRREIEPAARLLAWLAVGAALIGLYDRAVTGSVTKLPWYLWTVPDRFGFGQVWAGLPYEHTPARAVRNLLVTVVRWNSWWLGWPSSLVVVALWWRWGRPRAALWPWGWVALAIVLLEAVYYCPGASDFGVLYHFEIVIPASILAANAVVAGLTRWPAWTRALLAVHVALGTVPFVGWELWRLDRLASLIHASDDAVTEALPRPALVLYEPSCPAYRGWLLSAFSDRQIVGGYDFVAAPRPTPEVLDETLSAFPGYGCWYVSRDPSTGDAAATPCADAMERLRAPLDLKVGCECRTWPLATAERLGWYDGCLPR